MLTKLLYWKKQRVAPAVVAGRSHSEESLEGALVELWRNVALSKEEFNLTYAPAVRAAMAAADGDIHRKALYKRIKFALLASNGVIFGRTHGLDVEDSMVMSQAFAFAAIVAIALETYIGDDRIVQAGEWHPGWELFKAQDVLSKEGWEWLTQYPPVFNDWLACFLAPERSEIRKLLDMRPRTAVMEKAPKHSAGGAYLLWLKHKLMDEEIAFNTAKSHVHVLPEGRVFLALPSALQRYAHDQNMSVRAVQNKLKQLRIHEVDAVGNDTFGANVDGKNKEGMILCDVRVLFDVVPADSEHIAINDTDKK